MSEKTKEQLEDALDVDKKLKDERLISDRAYAIKLVERIVFGLLIAAFFGAMGFFIKAILKG